MYVYNMCPSVWGTKGVPQCAYEVKEPLSLVLSSHCGIWESNLDFQACGTLLLLIYWPPNCIFLIQSFKYLKLQVSIVFCI